MSLKPPAFVTPTSDERELLLGFLQYKREQVVATAQGLSDEQARTRPDGHLIPIAAVINHLTHVEWRWIDGRFRGETVSRSDEEFVAPTDRTLAEVIGAYRERWAATDAVVRAAPSMDAPCAKVSDPPLDLRFVVVHLIDETAHHAGHADAARELLDGATFDS